MAFTHFQSLRRSLPPGITGSQCGKLTIKIRDISFYSKTIKNINICISWWGEKDFLCMRYSAANVNPGEKVTANYDIRTSALHFIKYLKLCELRIRVFDQDTLKVIGFVTLQDLLLILSECPYKCHFPILDMEKQTIGKLYLEFLLVFFEYKPKILEKIIPASATFQNDKQPISEHDMHLQSLLKFPSPLAVKRDSPKFSTEDFHLAAVDPNKYSLGNELGKDNVKECVQRNFSYDTLFKCVRDVPERNGGEENKKDYILGNQNNATEEKKSTNFLKKWPALNNPSEVLRGSDELLKKSHSELKKIYLSKRCISQSIVRLPVMGFQIYFKIVSIELISKDSEIIDESNSNFTNQRGTYFIEYKFPSSNPEEAKIRPWKEPPQGIIMSSKKQTGSVIFFNQSSFHYLSKTHQMLSEQLDTIIFFRILFRSINQRVSSLIGEAKILLGDLLPENENLSNLHKLPIVNDQPNGKRIEGMLVLRNKWVHIAEGLKNSLEEDSEIKINKLRSDDSPPNSLHHIKTPNPDLCITNGGVTSTEREAPLLHILLHVSEAFYCPTNIDPLNYCKKTHFNFYLIFRAFWNKGISSKTNIVQCTNNPKFEFSHMLPVRINSGFVQMCQGNYMVLELWHKSSEKSKDDLLGIAKVPLHQFYLSCKDSVLLTEKMKLEHPVISMNGNVNIYNPTKPSKICGCVTVLLALGKQDQLQSMKQSNIMSKQSYGEISEEMNSDASKYYNVNQRTLINQCLKQNTYPIEKYFQIVKIKEFKLYSKYTSLNISDCYIEYRLPNSRHPLRTPLKPISSEILFSSTPVSIRILENDTEDIFFYLCFRSNDKSMPHDRIVATAKLSLKRFLVDNDCPDKTWMQKFTLPLNTEDLTKYTFCPGFLVIKCFDKICTGVERNELELQKSNSRQEKLLSPKIVSRLQNQESQTDTPCSNSVEQGSRFYHNEVNMDIKAKEGYSKENENLVESKAQETHKRCSDILPEINLQDIISSTSIIETSSNNKSAFPVLITGDICSSSNSSKVMSRGIISTTSDKTKSQKTDIFKVHIEIDKATNLSCESTIYGAYVTFWSYNKVQLWITSYDQPGDNPKWSWHCDTHLNGDLLIKTSDKLNLQVWTTRETNTEPNPSKDKSIGSAEIDLRILIYGMPQITGWYNIFSSTNKICGQIKVTVTPAEDLSKFKQIAVKNWFSDYLKNNKKLISWITTPNLTDLCLEENEDRNTDTKNQISKEEYESNLRKKELEIKPLSNTKYPRLKSKIAELDKVMKHYPKWTTTEVQDPDTQESHTESPATSQESSSSMSSNISRKLSKVNPSTELEILEKYVSQIVQSIHNNGSPFCESPMLEELFYNCENASSVVPERKAITEESDEVKVSGAVHPKRNHPGKDDHVLFGSFQGLSLNNMTENQSFLEDNLIDELDNKLNSDLVDHNDLCTDFFNRSEDSELNGEGKLVDHNRDTSIIPMEVVDLPRQAPEGGNPMEDETVANRTLSHTLTNIDDQNEYCVQDSNPVEFLGALDVHDVLERIENTLNATFIKK